MASTARVILAAWVLSGFCRAHAGAAAGPAEEAAVAADDECASGVDCALNALQLLARARVDAAVRHEASGFGEPAVSPEDGEDLGEPLIAPADPTWNDAEVMGYHRDDGLDMMVSALEPSDSYCTSHLQEERCSLYRQCRGRSYCVFGNYMVVPGRPIAGTEAINGANAHEYDYLFNVAKGLCGTHDCVLLTNPQGVRTQDQLHIQFRRLSGKGPSLRHRLEKETCDTEGWMEFNEHCCGCGHGKAASFSGQPGVFTEVAKAFGGDSLADVGISVFFGCGKTIVLATTHCSIEHTIS